MSGTLDPFWEYVENMNDGRKKCKFCPQTFARGISVSRVKNHLSGRRRTGVKICENVPNAVQAAACEAIDGPPEKKLKTQEDGMTDRSLRRPLQMYIGEIELHGGGTSQLPTTLQPTEPELPRMIDDLLMNDKEDDGMSDCSVGGALEWLRRNICEIELDHGGTRPEVLMVDPAENTLRTTQVGQEYETTYDISSSVIEDNVIGNNPEYATTALTQRVEGSGFLERSTVDEAEQPDNVVSNNPENVTTGLMQQVEGSRFLESFTVDEAEQPMHLENDDVLMNAEGNRAREPEQTIVRNRGEMEHHVGGTTHGDLMVNAALRTAQVSQDCEATLAIPDLLTEANFASSNMECTSMGLMQHPEGGGYHEGLQHTTGDEARDVFPTPKLEGGAFEENKKVICSWLMNNEVSLIGIYGMGGVGKTTLMKHIHNWLLDKPDRYRHVYWITVSQDFSIYKLQNLIAKHIRLDLSNEDGEIHRAAKLFKALAGRQNYVLILDDLWNQFEPKEMGVPSTMDGCKLIITTRSRDVCRRMGCEGNVIKVEPLSKEEAWNLFTMELGKYDIKLEPVAKAVADECDGLPLGIRTMARSMRGVYDEHEWRNALEELKEARVRLRDMEPEVFRILRYSYVRLNDEKLRQCFLYCALFPEDFEIEREELIEYFISERMIEGRKSRVAELDKGHEMLNQLVNACLLESATTDAGFSAVKMHDLVRDMALQQLRENSHVMVEAGEQLEELPDEEKWSQDLVRVSLMRNDIKEIPSSRSPSCPNLSTLLLNRNQNLKFIGDSFFKQMQRLEVLDLSDTAIQELPDSISDLVTLIALLLGGCSQLNQVPSLGKLRVLRKLDLHDTAVRELPRGLELLSSLRYLDLNWCKIRKLPVGILPKLCHLQVFIFFHINRGSSRPVIVEVEELARLRKLETLECCFDGLLAFKKYLKDLDHRKKGTQPPSRFKFVIGEEDIDDDDVLDILDGLDRGIYLHRQKIKGDGDVWVLPKGAELLEMHECSDMKSLCDFYPSHHETELESLLIRSCHSMKCLVSFSQTSLNMLGTIERLYLIDLDNLSFICRKARADPTPFLPGNSIFSHLKLLKIDGCPKLETLFPSGLLPNLGNLEVIEVWHCLNLEKIISEEESNISSGDLAIEFSLPKLQSLIFYFLPALTSFGCGKLVCNSLQKIRILYCERLKRLPFSCFPRTVKDITVGPKIWWESVEWDLKNDYRVIYL